MVSSLRADGSSASGLDVPVASVALAHVEEDVRGDRAVALGRVGPDPLPGQGDQLVDGDLVVVAGSGGQPHNPRHHRLQQSARRDVVVGCKRCRPPEYRLGPGGIAVAGEHLGQVAGAIKVGVGVEPSDERSARLSAMWPARPTLGRAPAGSVPSRTSSCRLDMGRFRERGRAEGPAKGRVSGKSVERFRLSALSVRAAGTCASASIVAERSWRRVGSVDRGHGCSWHR